MSAKFFIDAVLTVVDAKHVRYHLNKEGILSNQQEAGRQVAYADVIILNKVDLVSALELRVAEAIIRTVNPSAEIVEAQFCAVDTARLLDLRKFDALNPRSAAVHSSDLGAASNSAAAVAARQKGKHTGDIEALTIRQDVSAPHVALPYLEECLQDLVQRRWKDVLRVKGLLMVHPSGEQRGAVSSSRPFIVHGVHEELHGSFISPGTTQLPQDTEPALVVIGRKLGDDPAIQKLRELLEGGHAHGHPLHAPGECSDAACQAAHSTSAAATPTLPHSASTHKRRRRPSALG